MKNRNLRQSQSVRIRTQGTEVTVFLLQKTFIWLTPWIEKLMGGWWKSSHLLHRKGWWISSRTYIINSNWKIRSKCLKQGTTSMISHQILLLNLELLIETCMRGKITPRLQESMGLNIESNRSLELFWKFAAVMTPMKKEDEEIFEWLYVQSFRAFDWDLD